jgi:hypothetical protein
MKKISNKEWYSVQWLKRVRYETFTKKQAATAIERATPGQRALRERQVSQFSESMDLGAWWPHSPSQVPLMFDEEGLRMNGNTRLNALIKSKLDALVFPVIRGIPAEAYHFIDMDMKGRSGPQALPGMINVPRDAARVNWLHGIIIGDIFYSTPTATLEDKISKTYARQVEWANEVMPSGGTVGRAPYSVAFMYVHRVDPEFADKWGRSWYTGTGTPALPPALVHMRDAVHTASGNNKRARTGKAAFHAGGRLYTHQTPTWKMLNVLALLHQNKNLGRSIAYSSAGLKYWSELAKDGAWAAHSRSTTA